MDSLQALGSLPQALLVLDNLQVSVNPQGLAKRQVLDSHQGWGNPLALVNPRDSGNHQGLGSHQVLDRPLHLASAHLHQVIQHRLSGCWESLPREVDQSLVSRTQAV